jgi:hypothetical protein
MSGQRRSRCCQHGPALAVAGKILSSQPAVPKLLDTNVRRLLSLRGQNVMEIPTNRKTSQDIDQYD